MGRAQYLVKLFAVVGDWEEKRTLKSNFRNVFGTPLEDCGQECTYVQNAAPISFVYQNTTNLHLCCNV